VLLFPAEFDEELCCGALLPSAFPPHAARLNAIISARTSAIYFFIFKSSFLLFGCYVLEILPLDSKIVKDLTDGS